jgi:DegV family protein with EDD domain
MMKKITVITDSDSSLPVELAEQNGILLVPITIEFEGLSYTTNQDIDDRLLFELVDRRNKLPTTSAPSPGAFARVFEAAFKAGADALVCVCVSSKVSSTYQAALSACEQFPSSEIAVIDSLNLSMGQGFMALKAAEAARQGASVAEIVAIVESMKERLHTYAVLPTLKYLALSGRVGKFVAGMANTLNIKPVLTVKDGGLVLLERVRTQSKAMARMLELVRQSAEGRAIEQIAIIHVNNEAGGRELQAEVCSRLACPGQPILAAFTPGLSVHAGTGVVGVVILTRP